MVRRERETGPREPYELDSLDVLLTKRSSTPASRSLRTARAASRIGVSPTCSVPLRSIRRARSLMRARDEVSRASCGRTRRPRYRGILNSKSKQRKLQERASEGARQRDPADEPGRPRAEHCVASRVRTRLCRSLQCSAGPRKDARRGYRCSSLGLRSPRLGLGLCSTLALLRLALRSLRFVYTS